MSTDTTWLVVGLGNPGPQYADHRHNVGQHVLAELGGRLGGAFRAHKGRAAVLEGRLGVLPGGAPGPRVVLAAPTTYMNTSGGPVAALTQWFDVPVERLLVVHDELDLSFATLRLKRGGGEGGHNGLRSISASVGSKDYARLRVGIGRPPGRQDPADFVLRPFSTVERREMPFLLDAAADAVTAVLVDGWERAQQDLHSA